MEHGKVPNIFIFLVHFLVLGLVLFSSSSAAAAASDSSSSSIYNRFVDCLTNQTPGGAGAGVKISSLVYSPQNSSYSTVLDNYIRNRRFITPSAPKPLIIFTPLIPAHVQSSVICARNIGIQLKIRSGGHDYDGLSYTSDVPFLILDMFNLRSISIDATTDTAWVQSGATLGELYYKIAKTSRLRAFPAGVCPTVGVGGHLSGGGYGTLLRKYGLSVDNVLDAQIVDAKGRILDRKAMGEDLFWAIRGGGGASFGVVLGYKIQLVAVPETVTVFRVERNLAENATDIVHQWQFVADKVDDDLFVRILLQPITVKPKGAKSFKTIRASFISLFLGNAETLVEVMGKSFPELGLKKEECKEMSWIDSVLYWANFDPAGTPPEVLLNRTGNPNYQKRKSDYLQTPISKEGLESLWKKMLELGKVGLVLNPYGGKMSEIPASATPFPHRAGNIFKLQYSVNWNEEGDAADKNYLGQIRSLFSFMTPFMSKAPRGAYLNYRDIDIGVTDNNGNSSYAQGKVYGTKYFMGNFDRLVKVKTMVDPDNFFRNEQSIPTLPSKRTNSL